METVLEVSGDVFWMAWLDCAWLVGDVGVVRGSVCLGGLNMEWLHKGPCHAWG